jgi:hypothetical protein
VANCRVVLNCAEFKVHIREGLNFYFVKNRRFYERRTYLV